MTNAYIQSLNQYAAKVNARREENKRAKAEACAQAARERLTPLEDRLKRLLAKIPIEVQREGLSLSTLLISLRGRHRGNAHPGELGSALRKLGYVRKRDWKDEDGFRALWFPAE